MIVQIQHVIPRREFSDSWRVLIPGFCVCRFSSRNRKSYVSREIGCMSSSIEVSTFLFECFASLTRFLKTAWALRPSSSVYLDNFNCMVNVLAVVLVAYSSTMELFMILDPQITCLSVMWVTHTLSLQQRECTWGIRQDPATHFETKEADHTHWSQQLSESGQ